jgi:hypothetical protein
MNPYRFSLSLRVFHPTVTPQFIEAGLGLKAQVAHAAGKNRVTASGKTLPTISPDTRCSFLLGEGDDRILPDAINKWNAFLEAKRDFLGQLRSSGGRIEYFIGLFLDPNGGFELDYEQLRSLGDLGVSLSLDIYGPEQQLT